jgi:BMFP domain-containing protein YqiC
MKMNRRLFLRAAGVSLGLPVLESFGAPSAQASPRRMIAINQDLGFIPKHFFPKGEGRNYELSSYLETIADHRDQFTVFSGLSHPGVDGGHRADKAFLTAAPHPGRASFRNTISLDQLIANEVGHETRFRSLSLSINDPRSLSYTQAGVEIPTIKSASELYKKMFLQGNEKAVQAQLERLKRRGSILDVVMGQSKDLNKRVSVTDRERIDQFQTAVHSLEQRLTEAQAWETRPKPRVDEEMPDYPTNKKQFFEMIRMMNDMSRLALQTDSTRVITLFLGSQRTPGVNLDDGRSIGGYHNISHHGKYEAKLQQLAEIEVGQMELLGEFLQDLKDVEEVDGTLLDHTMVLYGCHMGDANIHNNVNLPILLAGGGFKHGQHLKFNDQINTPLCNVFVSMLQQMGIERDRFASSTGTLTGLERA